MPTNGLFPSWSWDLPIPKPFDKVEKRSTTAYSEYSGVASRTPRSTMHGPTVYAILQYIKLLGADSDLTEKETHLGAIGVQNDNYCIGEYVGAGGLECVVYAQTTGKFVACTLTDVTGSPKPYSLSEKNQSGTGLIFALLPKLIEHPEFMEKVQTVMQGIKSLDWESESVADQDVIDALFILCDNVYRRINAPSLCGEYGIPVLIPESGNIPILTAMTISKGLYSATETLLGNFEVLKAGITATRSTVAISPDCFEGKYRLSERTFSAAEELLIPKIPPWYVIPEEIVKICNHAKKTTGSVIPMRNFMLRGPSGTGKTEGARAIAAGLGLPYMHLTCGADDEKYDFIGQILPEFKETGLSNPTQLEAELPSLEECENDPISVYFDLTGDYDTTVTAEQVMELRQNKLDTLMAEDASSASAPSYRYIKTQLIEAMEKGYLIELQEPSVILKAGVLVSLNSLFDTSSSSIQLMTGETIHRHPDAVVVITTNTNYEGCRQMNQSIISRMNLVIDMDTIEPRIMAERAMKITGCTDKTLVRKMAEVLCDIDETYRESMDGVCGMRELISWVQSYMICENVIEAADDTVVSSFSADSEARREMRDAFITSRFAA